MMPSHIVKNKLYSNTHIQKLWMVLELENIKVVRVIVYMRYKEKHTSLNCVLRFEFAL